jgi:hypothetical protein
MALIEIDDFPSERKLHIYGWDFPWQTVSHNQMVDVHSDFLCSIGQIRAALVDLVAPGQFHHLLWTFFGVPPDVWQSFMT